MQKIVRAFILTSLLFTSFGGLVHADTIGTKVSGIVRDSTLGPLENITVRIECNGQTKFWVTDENGYYEVKFLKLVCRREYLVSAQATYKGETLYMNALVDDNFDAPIDFMFGAPSVPEYNATTGLIAVIGACGAWYVVQKKQQIA